jgi:hypothetical protein
MGIKGHTYICSTNPLKGSYNYMYQPIYHSVTQHFTKRVYLCVSYDSENELRLFT